MDYDHVKKQLGYGIQTESKDNAIKAIEQLTARVAELEAENELLRGQIAALRQQRDGLLKALENCRLLAARHRKEEWATHILRFCGESGVIGSPIRDNVIASVKEKA